MSWNTGSTAIDEQFWELAVENNIFIINAIIAILIIMLLAYSGLCFSAYSGFRRCERIRKGRS